MHESDFEEQQEPKNAAQSRRFAQAHRATAMIEDRNLIAKKEAWNTPSRSGECGACGDSAACRNDSTSH
jgi:hypothetical protein